MPKNRLFGLETEYAFSALGRNGQRLDRSEWSGKFMEHATRRLPSLPDKSAGGMFLASGGRFYRDSGHHPELTTPEVTNPWDICRYVDAGDRLLTQVAEGLSAEYRDTVQFVLNRSNVSYGPNQSTWACHESYGHRTSPDRIPAQLTPHLVSRIIYTGAGGFDNRTPGIDFMISPRVAHITHWVSERSQSERGICHTKDESLSGSGHHRLHVLCGDSLCSHLSNWLRVATTALIVALIEAGESPGSAVALRDPVSAMWGFSRDQTLGFSAACQDGAHQTALQIQRHYLAQVSAKADREFMPPWTNDALTLWRRVLSQLEHGPEAVSRSLDWSIKRTLFQQTARRAGFEWDRVPLWSRVLVRLCDALIQEGRLTPENRLSPGAMSAAMATAHSQSSALVATVMPLLEASRLDPRQLADAIQLRQQLHLLDTRFSELGRQGIFSSLDAAGVLDHRIVDAEGIETAMDHPPAEGRAKLRGDLVRRFFHRRQDFSATWNLVIDEREHRTLDLNDPFETREDWKSFPAAPEPASRPGPLDNDTLLRRATEAYTRGAYDSVIHVLGPAVHRMRSIDTTHRSMIRMASLAKARRGDLSAVTLMREVDAAEGEEIQQIIDWACVFRFLGLAPRPETREWIERGIEFFSRRPAGGHDVWTLRDHHTAWLLAQEQHDAARELLEPLRSSRPAPLCERLYSRMLISLAEADRRTGRAQEAHRLTEMAERIQVEQGYAGDLAEFTLPMKARLELDPSVRLQYLNQARVSTTGCFHAMAKARSLLLEARIRGDSQRGELILAEALEIRNRTTALRECRLMSRILDHWTAWTSHQPIPGAGDYFAGV